MRVLKHTLYILFFIIQGCVMQIKWAKVRSNDSLQVLFSYRDIVSFSFLGGLPAMHTKFMQYRFPRPSGKLCPRCVPSILTVSPFGKTRTFDWTTSRSRKEGQPCALDSARKASIVLPIGAMNKGLPVTES